jgi:hypothetical protein
MALLVEYGTGGVVDNAVKAIVDGELSIFDLVVPPSVGLSVLGNCKRSSTYCGLDVDDKGTGRVCKLADLRGRHILLPVVGMAKAELSELIVAHAEDCPEDAGHQAVAVAAAHPSDLLARQQQTGRLHSQVGLQQLLHCEGRFLINLLLPLAQTVHLSPACYVPMSIADHG